jgi:hypothetical protein
MLFATVQYLVATANWGAGFGHPRLDIPSPFIRGWNFRPRHRTFFQHRSCVFCYDTLQHGCPKLSVQVMGGEKNRPMTVQPSGSNSEWSSNMSGGPRREMEVEHYPFFNIGTRWGGWLTSRPDRFNPRERNRYLGCIRDQWRWLRKILSTPRFEPSSP